jgi:hypothetical protein
LALVCRCIVVRFGLVSLNMRRILLILIYVGTFLMSQGFKKDGTRMHTVHSPGQSDL